MKLSAQNHRPTSWAGVRFSVGHVSSTRFFVPIGRVSKMAQAAPHCMK